MDLSFKISTFAELAGAEATAKALEMQIGRAKALKQDYSALQQQLETVKESLEHLTPKLHELKETEEHATETAHLLHHNHRALHQLFHEMGKESVPELGHALIGMMYGPLGPALALMSAFSMVKGGLEDFNAELDAEAQSGATANFAAGCAAVKTAMDGAGTSLTTYNQHLADVAANHVTIVQALQAQVTLMREVATEQEKARKIEEDLKNAQTDHAVKLGRLTPEQGEATKAKDEVAGLQAEADAKRKEEDAALAALGIAAATAQQTHATAKKDYEDKVRKHAEDEAHRNRLAADFGPDAKGSEGKATANDIPELIKKMDEERAAIEKDPAYKHFDAMKKEYERNPSAQNKVDLEESEFSMHAVQIVPGLAGFGKSLADRLDELEKMEGQLNTLQHGKRQYEATQTPESKTQSALDAQAVEDAKKKSDETFTAAMELLRQAEETRKTQERTRPIQDEQLAAQIATIMQKAIDKLETDKPGTSVKGATEEADLVERAMAAARIADQYQRTHAVSQEDAATMMKFANQNGANASTADESSAFVLKNFGNIPQHETTPVDNSNIGDYSSGERLLLGIANALGAHVNTVAQAADYVEKLEANTKLLFDKITDLANKGFTAQQEYLDALAQTVASLHAKSHNPQL